MIFKIIFKFKLFCVQGGEKNKNREGGDPDDDDDEEDDDDDEDGANY